MNVNVLADAMRKVVLDHAARLQAIGPVRVWALDPCPRCGGQIIASESVARCTRCDFAVTGGGTQARRVDVRKPR